MNTNSVGIVKPQSYTCAEPPDAMRLESGETLGPVTLAYETYGSLNKQKDNAILITHALSGDAHAAGRHHEHDRKPGWWDFMIGPGRAMDTDKYFIICSNVIGGCQGSTGPSSVNPRTGQHYNLDFPVITIRDMVKAQTFLIDHLGIERLRCAIGGSMGGMQVLEWGIAYPDRVAGLIPMATTSRLNAQGIAFDEVGRQAIYADPNWRSGNYLNHQVIPREGLSVARMLAHITYLSEASMHEKFGRRLREKERYGYDFSTDFEVESYLRYQGQSFTQRFDANSYLYITKAIDYFDLIQDHGSLENAFRHITAKMLVVSFSSDWLFPTSQAKDIVRALKLNRKHVSFCEIDSPYGHDSFLLPHKNMEKMLADFIYEI
ncbi:MAG: homoserine O-acetyltransferase [candidate division KSB1 bacterium]|nr:homoserine O-acetyltransferase [candidate division KSB1 bacterium]